MSLHSYYKLQVKFIEDLLGKFCNKFGGDLLVIFVTNIEKVCLSSLVIGLGEIYQSTFITGLKEIN